MTSTSFYEQKKVKKLFYSGAWVEAPVLPHHCTGLKRVFFGSFFQKRAASFLRAYLTHVH
jgi:hypothetical protein